MALCAVGLLNLYSATYHLDSEGPSALFFSQLTWFGIGLVVGLVTLLIDYRVLLRLAYPLYFFSVFLLLMVLFFGKDKHFY